MKAPLHVPLADARSAPTEAGRLSALLAARGSMQLRYYKTPAPDPQGPHDQDELYFVQCGSGWFVNGEIRHAFSPGDALFVAAGVVHRFEAFGDDLEVWVVFWGPLGGEA